MRREALQRVCLISSLRNSVDAKLSVSLFLAFALADTYIAASLSLYCSHSILHIGSEQDGRRRSGLLRERGHGSLLRAALLVGAAADRGVRTASLDSLLARVRRQVDAHVSGE